MEGQTAWSQGAGISINDNAGAGDLYTTLSADRIISLVVAASYGIRYSVALINDLNSLVEIQALDLAVVNENRWVYRFDGVLWEMFFQLDAAHNHDSLYATLNHNHDTKYLGISAKASDSSLLEGARSETADSTNTIVKRNSSGDITTRLFRSNYANQSGAPATAAAIAFRNSVSDNYIRFLTASGFSSWCQNASIKTYDSARLGGIAASSYLRSNTSDTFTGTLTIAGTLYFNNSTTRIYEGSTNTVRIYTNSYYVDIGPRNSSWCHVDTNASSGMYFYDSLTASDFKLSSDIRFKKNIKQYENGLDKVLALKLTTFDWDEKKKFQGKARKGHDLGLIAQWTEKVEPMLVSTDTDGYKSVKYNKITILNSAAIQEFYVKQDFLNKEVEKRLSTIERTLGIK